MEFRRLCLIEPDSADPAFRQHQAGCEACAAFARGQRELDARIARAMNVPVPGHIGAEAMLGRGIRQMRRWRVGAIAAGIVLAAAASVTLVLQTTSPSPPPEVAQLQHKLTEHMLLDPLHAVDNPAHLAAHEHPATLSLKDVVASLGGTLRHEPEGLMHAVICAINGKQAGHLVLKGRFGPVTAFIMPDNELQGSYHTGAGLLRTYISGSRDVTLALVGNENEGLPALEEQLREALAWPDQSPSPGTIPSQDTAWSPLRAGLPLNTAF